MKSIKFKFLFLLFLVLNLQFMVSENPKRAAKRTAPAVVDGMKLVWAEEFNYKGAPDSSYWSFEHGFVRNEELQWYQKENAYCKNGVLVIEGRKERVKNTAYNPNSKSWKHKREFAEYTASSINTRAKKEFLYGRFEIRARIDTSMGLWPAIWTLGVDGEWPSNGEIDIMESYPIDGVHSILANVASGTTRRYNAKWDSEKFPLEHFLKKDPQWPSKFHVWRMDWDDKSIKLYLDNELLNETDLLNTVNPDGTEPFKQPHYLLLNLAIGGQNGGDPSKTKFPNRYEVDYVRVYQK